MALAWVAPIIRPVDGLPGRFAPLIIAALGSYAMVKILSPARAAAPSAR